MGDFSDIPSGVGVACFSGEEAFVSEMNKITSITIKI